MVAIKNIGLREKNMPKGRPLTEEEQDSRRHDIFAAVSRLFIERGFVETSMREIAEAAGMGKSSLYDYFKSKDEILIWYFQDEFSDMIEILRDVAGRPLSAVEKLRLVLYLQLDQIAKNKEISLKLYAELQRLGGEGRKLIRSKRHEFQDLLSGIVEQGIREGAFRSVDPLLATHIVQMAVLSAVFTLRPSGSPYEMLEEALGIFLRGVQTTSGPR